MRAAALLRFLMTSQLAKSKLRVCLLSGNDSDSCLMVASKRVATSFAIDSEAHNQILLLPNNSGEDHATIHDREKFRRDIEPFRRRPQGHR